MYHVPKDFAFRAGRVMEIFNGQNDLQIHLSALGEFLLTQLPEWEKFATVDLDKKLEDMYDTSELHVKIYLNYEDAAGLEAKVLFAYGDTEFYPLLGEKLPLSAKGTILVRDMTKETEILDLFSYFSFEVQDEVFLQKDDEKTFDFLKQGLPILMGMPNVEIFYADSLKKKPIENHHFAGNGAEGRIALVVVPASLIYNWQAEIKRFAPALRAELVYGDKPHRRMLLGRLAGEGRPDLLLTTYGMLKRDIDEYAKIKFSYCFLDEAQHIKNMAAKVTRAAKKIQAGSCFALTGTPIENNLSELWSIFDFLLPGYLHDYPMFMGKYELPIIRENNTKASNKLLRRIAPFILRRMKKDVLAELPEKIEGRMVSEMTELQQKVYKSYFAHSQRYLRKQLMKHGLRQGEILKIIALLTRLRQIACDPGVFLQNYDGGSGKLNMLDEIVQDAVAAGHHLLIFSQFTGMLDRIGERLQGRNIAYYRLDGKTPVGKRMELVENFNQGQVPVFLISLKAGGTGLNLTGADMVIHFDPWWNPAVEDQATDRAYRIGQSKNVQVIKLIAQGTIEEKIYDLQERKKDIIAKLIKPGERFINGLDEQDIVDLFS